MVDKTTAPSPAPAFAPAPEQPLPRAAPAAIPVAAPASPPVAAKPPPPPQVVMLAPDAPPVAAPPKKAAPASAPRLAPAPRLAAAAPPAERPVVHHSASVTIASLTDDALSRHTRAARAVHDDQATKPWQAEAPKLIAPPARHAAVAAHKGAQAPATRLVGAPAPGWVQIGAFSSPTLADQGWRDIARLAPAAMAGKGKAVQPLDRDDGTTLYRAYVTGFASVAAAQNFCAGLQASGKACIVK